MSKCNYCAFFSRPCANPDWDAYANGILSEIDKWGDALGRVAVPTIFFGGGTPSLMPVKIFEQIIARLARTFNLSKDCEITLESNPGTLTDDKLSDFMTAGMNRLSIGVQRLNDDELKFLGRRHDANAARRLIQAGLHRGLRVSADFIYGLPGDDARSVAALCREINNLGLRHCSMYELTIEHGTPFAGMNLNMPDNDAMAEMYDAIDATLNMPRYEVSNYAAPGDECKHNQNIWDGAPYIGIGRGAAGRPFIAGVWYEQLGAGEKFEKLSMNARAVEMVLTGMRTRRGVKLTPCTRGVINMDFAHGATGLVEISGDRLRATKQGILILDDLMIKLVK